MVLSLPIIYNRQSRCSNGKDIYDLMIESDLAPEQPPIPRPLILEASLWIASGFILLFSTNFFIHTMELSEALLEAHNLILSARIVVKTYNEDPDNYTATQDSIEELASEFKRIEGGE